MEETKRKHRVIEERFVVRNPYLYRGVWFYNVRDLLDPARKVLKISSHEKNARKAEEFILKWVKKKAQRPGTKPTVDPRNFPKAFEEWLGTLPLRDSTRNEYEYCGDVYERFFGTMLVSDIHPEEIDAFLASLRVKEFKNKKGELLKKGLSGTTIRKHLRILRSFFQWAIIRRKYCLSDPTLGLKIGKA